MSAAIDDLGGIGAFVKPGEKVLLKANLLMEKRPEDATLTHPSVLKAITRILMDNGNTVIIGDSPGGPFTETMLAKIYRTGGYYELAEQTGASLNANFKSFERENPEGLLLKKLTLTDMLNDADKVISVSKLKTHGMMTFTGAVKNMFGTVPGIMKAEYHLNMPEYDDFANALIDICLAAGPVLSIMDGIVGMEGHGPSAGEARQLGVVLASASPFALDRVACEIISLPSEKVPTLRGAAVRGLCEADVSEIEIIGGRVSDFQVTDFAIPKPSRINPSQSLPPIVQKLMSRALQPRPVFLTGKCTGCGVCVANCPVKVISFAAPRDPRVKLDGCIRCYCCQELCGAKAVVIRRPFLMRLFVENLFSGLTSSIIKKIQYRKRR
ncbi:MAG: DUF362 domain-containing protein [Defluviitaleaceae bacterium]|nr:DUF362 domain-containing protein [Defluviitaleaceae bacterium]